MTQNRLGRLRLTALVFAAALVPFAVAKADDTKFPGPKGAKTPTLVVLRPDLAFQEIQVFYPEFNRGFRLVPPGGPSTTSVFRLVENHNVPLGTSLGPQEPNGAPGPVATRSCQSLLKATFHIVLVNGATKTFDATTVALGLTAQIDGTSANAAFGAVAAGATKYLEVGSFSLTPTIHTAVLKLNTAHGGGETNFENNDQTTQFEITCQAAPAPKKCPVGQEQDPLTGVCKPAMHRQPNGKP